MPKIIINDNEDKLSYLVKSRSNANLDTLLDDWIKFLSYVKPDELSFLNEIEKKSPTCLTDLELEKYLKIKNQQLICKLFIKYKNKNCTKEEHNQVFNYMDNNIEKYMCERLTKEEIEYADEKLIDFRNLSQSDLQQYIDKQMINYNNLTLFDIYILYKVREIKYNKSSLEFFEKNRDEQLERHISLKKSLIKDYGLDVFK